MLKLRLFPLLAPNRACFAFLSFSLSCSPLSLDFSLAFSISGVLLKLREKEGPGSKEGRLEKLDEKAGCSTPVVGSFVFWPNEEVLNSAEGLAIGLSLDARDESALSNENVFVISCNAI